MASVTAYPGTVVNNNLGGSAWASVNNAKADDGTNATQANNGSLKATEVDDALDCTAFDFSAIPDDATIDGIELTVERNEYSTSSNMYDHTVQLFREGTLVGDNKADTVNEWPTTMTAKTYGGPTDLWGATWTVAQIKASTSGARFRNQHISRGNNNGSNQLDYLRITVHYTEASSNQPPRSMHQYRQRRTAS